ncbi:MAG: DNA replication initiation control protein YabA [Peptococcaceae bacterium]|nr:DNA replication initiation control protein YabA [Peptococcaceae bacterium]
MEAKIQDVSADLVKFKRFVHLLEEENARLKSELARHLVVNNCDAQNIDPVSSDSLDSLINLYDRGFHVCPMYFGGLRQEDCLFCSALIHKAGEVSNE